MSEAEALVCGYVLDGTGAARELDWTAIKAWRPDAGRLWLHLDRRQPETRQWLEGESGLDPVIVEALLQEETRPRCEAFGEGLLVILRGVNLNPNANPEDMISVRIWIDGSRIITTRAFKLMAVQDIRDRLAQGQGPADVAGLLVSLATGLIDRMSPVLVGLEDLTDGLEEEMIEQQQREARGRVAEIRRQAIALRRYLAPQREAIARLQEAEAEFLQPEHRLRLREVQHRTVRYLEDLDALRERAAVMQEELANRLSEQMNRTMYVLTIVASIMLPLGFITGLLGVNVGGIPGADDTGAFLILCILLALLVAAQVMVFRRMKWL